MADIKDGLEGILALETSISFIDGKEGVLEYRGRNIQDLIDRSFDEIVYLLLHRQLPNEKEHEDFTKLLRSKRDLDESTKNVLRLCNYNIEAMDALRTAISHMSHCDPDLNDNSFEANIRKAIRLIAKTPTIVSGFQRVREGETLLEPDLTLSHGANFLYMLKGEKPSSLEARIMETDFILSAEHELNASTFSTRVTASTLSDIHSAIISGLGTLKGTLHGGARLAVINLVDDIESPEKTEEYIMDLIRNKQRIMGFGHRVYKTIDPRAKIFKKMAREIAEEKDDMKWYTIAETIENVVIREIVEKKGKPIYPNVDFYAGIIYKYLDLPARLATAIFAIGRISGWIAHCLEQYKNNRLIRPRAKYIGEHNVEVK
ncbi:MAG: citrate/2-methylcitrate synthase [Candidatus Heimdallarchaeota archaeon]|nr:citrate/2-methylcitrate synthase [Candidatus Heimdallarchaeota archaeon]